MILLKISEFWTISHFVEFFILTFFTELLFFHENPSKFQPRFIAIPVRSEVRLNSGRSGFVHGHPRLPQRNAGISRGSANGHQHLNATLLQLLLQL